MEYAKADQKQISELKKRSEGHFFDFKSKRIPPAKLCRSVCAFANADGGEIYVGIEDPKNGWKWDGFENEEATNAILQVIYTSFPLGDGIRLTLIDAENEEGYVLRIEVAKTSDIKTATDDKIYVRSGAQNLPIKNDQELDRLKFNKGIKSFEDTLINTTPETIYESENLKGFLKTVIPTADGAEWLKKQRLVRDGKPTVAGTILFSDEPQIDLPKASVKVYRYKTSESEGTRSTLEFTPITIEGNAYQQIYNTVAKVTEIAEKIPVVGASGLEKIQYPQVAIHEIVTNAIIHRDYSLNDDVHVRIFDNRIEVESPGVLPAHITEENILKERFARNPRIVRLLNKHENPPNKDVGEGLNSSFQAMRELKLKEPEIIQNKNSVLVILKHEKLGSSEEMIVNYLRDHQEINNTIARDLCAIGDANKMKRVFQGMMKADIIERIPGRAQVKAAYRRGKNFPQEE